MKDQINTIRTALTKRGWATEKEAAEALTALTQLEAMVGEQKPVAYAIFAENGNIRLWSTESQHVKRIAQEKGLSLVPLYAAPVAQPQAEPKCECDATMDTFCEVCTEYRKWEQPQAEEVPTIYVSRGQLENLKPDPEDEAGTYLPVRKTPKGKFTHPLFAAPQQAEVTKTVATHDDTDLIEQMLEALRSCSGVPHWPALIPTINAARKRLETPQQAEAVPKFVWGYAVRNPKEPGVPHKLAHYKTQADAHACQFYCAEIIPLVAAAPQQAEVTKTVATHDDTDLIEQMLEALRSCSGVPHWPALIPTINAARKRLETPQQAEAVPPGYVLVPKRMTKAMEYVTEQEDWTWGDLLAAAEAITEAEYSEMAQAEAVPSDVVRDAMVVAGARVLNQRAAEACGVNADDHWAIYAEDFKDDVRAVLAAAQGEKP
jgi:hypothetical protein